jgi:uridine kinase
MNKSIIWTEIDRASSDILINEATERILSNITEISHVIYSNLEIKFIFITGPSSSGKTTFANLLEEKLDSMGLNSHTLSLDNFFLNRDDLPVITGDVKDFDSINALDIPEINKCFHEIINSDKTSIPQFDFIKGKRIDRRHELTVSENDVIIVEGIHSFNPLIQGTIDSKFFINIYIEPMTDIIFDEGTLKSVNLRLIRRMNRDRHTRGHAIESTLNQWKYVRESEEKYIYPYKDKANYLIDTFAAYEAMIYRGQIYPYFSDSIKAVCPELDLIKNFRPLSTECVPHNSIIKEFTIFDRK